MATRTSQSHVGCIGGDHDLKEDQEALGRNAEIGRRFAAAMISGDAEEVVALLNPDVVWNFPGTGHPLAGAHAGLGAVAQFAAAVAELAAGAFAMTLDGVYGGPAGAVISFTGTGSHPDSRRLSNPTKLVLVIADGGSSSDGSTSGTSLPCKHSGLIEKPLVGQV